MAHGWPCGAASLVQVSIYSMQRSPRYWRDPLAFKPERFLAGTPDAAEVIARVAMGRHALTWPLSCLFPRPSLQRGKISPPSQPPPPPPTLSR
jgi:cytochrome P450